MQLTNTLVFLSVALSVSAHPSAVNHRHQHERRSDSGFYRHVRPKIPAPVTPEPEVKAASVPENVDPSPPAQDPAPATSGGGGTGVKKEFCAGMSKRATLENIHYMGNLGSGEWGCNWMEIENGDVSLYPYTMTFHSPSEAFTCHCFNKFGPDHKLTGSFQNAALTLHFAKGETKSVALDDDTQGACACAPGDDVPICAPIGQWTGTWVEMDMGSKPNGGQSGADVSVLAVQDCAKNTGGGQASFPGMRLQAPGKGACSWVKTNGADHFQAYIDDTHHADGIGCTGYTENNLDVVLGDDFESTKMETDGV